MAFGKKKIRFYRRIPLGKITILPLVNVTKIRFFIAEEYGQYYGQMNTMNPHTMRTMKQQHEGKKIKKRKYFKIFLF